MLLKRVLRFQPEITGVNNIKIFFQVINANNP